MILKLPHACKGSRTSNYLMGQFALMVRLVIIDLVVVLFGVVF